MSRTPQSPADATVYKARRRAYMDALGPDAVALIHSPPESVRNGDAHYRYRQSSDLYYLTGFTEPGATLVLRPGADSERVTLFVRPRDPEQEVWHGRRAGVEGAVARFGVDKAHPVGELRERLPALLENVEALHYSLGIDPGFDRLVASIIARMRRTERRGKRPPRAVVDPRGLLHEHRLHKAPDELALLRRAAAITCAGHCEAMRAAGEGVGEQQLEAVLEFVFRVNGGVGPGYGSIVGAGENATILHYIDNCALIDAGDLVLIDAGCEYGLYTADVTRTFPASGRFSDAQRRVYELVLETQKAAVAAVAPGATIDGIHEQVVEQLTAGMIDLGLLSGSVAERIEDNSYQRFYMHRTSHWLGLDVHDVGDYQREQRSRPLEPGMVITVEPGLYIAREVRYQEDDEDKLWVAPEELAGIGIRIEDDILVTADGHEDLTAAAPKEIADVEAMCGEASALLSAALRGAISR